MSPYPNLKWHDFPIVKFQIPCSQEALHTQKMQEVYFLASGQCGLNVNHAYLPDKIEHNKYVKQQGHNHKYSATPLKK